MGENSPRRLTDRVSGLEDVTLPILWSCQLATFVGLVAVLEDSKGSASIPELARLIRADGTKVPAELEAETAVICDKHRVFRNKLFSHNSTQREHYREIFDEEKISWDQLDADLDAVTRILFQIADKNQELSLDLAPLMAFNHAELSLTALACRWSGFIAHSLAPQVDVVEGEERGVASYWRCPSKKRHGKPRSALNTAAIRWISSNYRW